jgi:MoxR-like ATPase
MFLIKVGYPTQDEERKILAMTTAGYKSDVQPVLERQEILDLQRLVRKVHIPEDVVSFILRLVRSTRSSEPDAPDFIKRWINWGASPRASQNLVIGAKAKAILDGRHQAKVEDVMHVAHAVLGHRIMPNFAAEADRVTTDQVIDQLLKAVA